MGLGRGYGFPYNVYQYAKPKSYYRAVKHGYQRLRYGVSFRDEWSLDYYLIDILLHSLPKYLNTGEYGQFARKELSWMRNWDDPSDTTAADAWDARLSSIIEQLRRGKEDEEKDTVVFALKELAPMFKGLWW